MKMFLLTLVSTFSILLVSISLACSAINENTELKKINDYDVIKKVEWVNVNGISLSMDIYTPKTGKAKYPVLVIYHGGAWMINTNSTMDSMSTYIVQHGEYIVCNVNYRLLGDNDNTITINQIIEDAMGALAWIKDNIEKYKGDKEKIVLTGDSAGGHLAAMVLLASRNLNSKGFINESFGYNPTYLPSGKTAADLAKEKYLDVQGAILSYAAFDMYASCLGGFETQGNFFWAMAGKAPRGIFGNSINAVNNANYYKAVSPLFLIPNNTIRTLPPQLCLVGSNDNLTTPASIKAYVDASIKEGQKVEYWVHEGRPHAFLDSQKNVYLGTEFRKDAPPALDKMLEFMDKLFY